MVVVVDLHTESYIISTPEIEQDLAGFSHKFIVLPAKLTKNIVLNYLSKIITFQTNIQQQIFNKFPTKVFVQLKLCFIFHQSEL